MSKENFQIQQRKRKNNKSKFEKMRKKIEETRLDHSGNSDDVINRLRNKPTKKETELLKDTYYEDI